MKILLTGHKGSHLTTSSTQTINQQNTQIIGIDIKDNPKYFIRTVTREVDMVIHPAGVGGVLQSIENPKTLLGK